MFFRAERDAAMTESSETSFAGIPPPGEPVAVLVKAPGEPLTSRRVEEGQPSTFSAGE